MPSRICLEPSCPEPAAWRGRCPTHARERNRETRTVNASLYNSKRWKMTRRTKLAANPICECCDNRIATDVHHKIDLREGGDPWAIDGLEALCHACHSQETRARQHMLG